MDGSTPRDRKTAEPAKAPSSEFDAATYRVIFEHAPVGIFHSTPQGRFLRVNEAFARILGYDSPAALIEEVTNIGEQTYADPARRADILARATRDGHVTGEIVPGRRRDGTLFHARVSVVALRDARGAVTGFVGASFDVTDLVDTQRTLARTEAEYREIFEHASEGIYKSSAEGRQLRANPALVRLNGYAGEREMLAAVNDIGREWYVDPGRRDEFKRRLDRDGRVVGFESEIYRHKSRERIWIVENAWIRRDADGGIAHYAGTVREITQEKRMAEALELSRRRMRDFAEVASDWFWETDADHRVTFLSDNATTSGLKTERVLGRRRWEVAADFADEPEKWAAHRAVLERHEAFRDFVYRIEAAALPGLQHIALNGKPVFAADGTFEGYRGVARLITEQVRAARRLADAKAEAERASAAKSAFLANMSHELRTPLNAVIGFAEMMERGIHGPIGVPRYESYVRDIRGSAGHLLQLIEDILDLSKAESGGMHLAERSVRLDECVASAIQMLAARAERGRVALGSDVPEALPALRADPRRLRQILLNLVSNAIKFTPPGGSVRVEAALEPEGALRLTVRDTGAGIAEADLDRVFQPFVQLKQSPQTALEGTGLGLPLTRRLVEAHGATLALASRLGVGTEAVVRFPPERLAA